MSKFRSALIISLIAICVGLIPVSAALAEGRSPIVKFQGVILSRPDGAPEGEWEIGEHTVLVDEGTAIVESQGEAVVDAEVVVVAKQSTDGVLTALIIRVLRSDKPGRTVNIRGVVSEVEPGYIVVNGLQIRVTQQTRVEGELAEGEFVAVQARAHGSELTALRIQVRTRAQNRVVEFVGKVEAIDEEAGVWTISGKEVLVDEETEIQGEPQVGDLVAVRACLQDDGSLLAVRIRLIDPELPQPEDVTFTGVIQRFAPNMIGYWVIGGQGVVVKKDTVITGTPEIGAEAEVQGLRYGDGVIIATEITISEGPEELTFTGTVVRMPPGRYVGLWVIDTWRVIVVPDTEVIGDPQVGATVRFTVKQHGHGALVATRIEVLATPEPTIPPEPTVPANDGNPTVSGTPEPGDAAKPSKYMKLPKGGNLKTD